MAKRIDQLTAAGALAGANNVAIAQGTGARKTTLTDIAAFVGAAVVAADIAYDNDTSLLVADDVQAALDEIDADVDTLQSTVLKMGLREIVVMAAAMQPSASGGCGTFSTSATSANHPDRQFLPFDSSTQEYAQFCIPMPKSWNKGTVTFAPIWMHPATVTNFGVVWDLQGVAVSNDDTLDVAYGTAQTSSDTGGTTDDVYIGPTSSAITIAGSPANGDLVCFRLSRVTGDVADTMAVDAYLLGIRLYVSLDAANDA